VLIVFVDEADKLGEVEVKLVRERCLLLFQVTHRNDLLAHGIVDFSGQQ
jgi:hypothetical protein